MSIYIFGSGGGGGTSGTDTSNDTIESKYVLNPYTFHDKNGNAGTGLIYNWDGTILAGGSTDGNKVTIQPASSVRHIAAGSYINREIELAAMPAGSVALSQSGNKVTATRTAGYVTAGSQDLTLAAGSTSLSRSGATVTLTRQAGYITAGTDQLTVPLASHTVNITSNGTTTVNPLSGTAGYSVLTINTSVAGSVPSLQNRSVTITANGTTTYYPTGAYDGMASMTVTTAVPATAPAFDVKSVTPGSTSMTVSCSATPYMFGFVANTTTTGKIASGMGRRGSNTGRGYVADYGAGNVLSISWSTSYVTISVASGFSSYSFDTSKSYDVWVAYI